MEIKAGKQPIGRAKVLMEEALAKKNKVEAELQEAVAKLDIALQKQCHLMILQISPLD